MGPDRRDPAGSRIVARLAAMGGPVALLGADEFLPVVAALDTELLAATGRPRPRVAILPTASRPYGETSSGAGRRWASTTSRPSARRSRRSLSAIGPRPTTRRVSRRSVRPTSSTSPAAIRATCSARWPEVPSGLPRSRSTTGVVSLPAAPPARWCCATARRSSADPRTCRCATSRHSGSSRRPRRSPTTTGCPRPWRRRWFSARHEARSCLGLDEGTAAIGRDGGWQVRGRGRVTVWRGRHRERYRDGDAFRL